MSATAPQIEQPQITLITPPIPSLEIYPAQLAAVLDQLPIACLRLSLAVRDEAALMHMIDALREVAHARDVAVVLESHLSLVEKLGLDGVHLGNGARNVRKARKELGAEAIVGAFCEASQHEGLNAGEGGADYVAFGPVGLSSLGDGAQAELDLFEWWSDMIEVPIVCEGALTPALIETFAPFSDHFAIGAEIWEMENPQKALKALIAPLGLG